MKRTKIVATISDRRCDIPFLTKLYESGVNVVRLNTAHQNLDDALKVINNVRAVSEEIAILVDTKGPEVRTINMDEPLFVEKGDRVFMTGDVYLKQEKIVYVSYKKFTSFVEVGQRILIDDGDIELVVIAKNDDCLELIVSNSGSIKNKKSINVPGVSMNLNSLSGKDKEFIQFAIENNIDFIAHSFVRNKEDVIEIQRMLDRSNSTAKIIAKIENQEGVDNIDEILDHVYGVMVARGDLAIELEMGYIPRVQRYIVDKCVESKKPVIIATQMLHTMIENPRPTRAEVSDIANAVLSGTDAIMLSGETAYGEYPVEAVRLMAKVAALNESSTPIDANRNLVRINNETTAALARVAVRMTTMLDIKAIVVDTLTGRTARYLSAFRGGTPVYAACYSKKVMRELALSFGVESFYVENSGSHKEFLNQIPSLLLDHGFKANDKILVLGGSFKFERGASFIEVRHVVEE